MPEDPLVKLKKVIGQSYWRPVLNWLITAGLTKEIDQHGEAFLGRSELYVRTMFWVTSV